MYFLFLIVHLNLALLQIRGPLKLETYLIGGGLTGACISIISVALCEGPSPTA